MKQQTKKKIPFSLTAILCLIVSLMLIIIPTASATDYIISAQASGNTNPAGSYEFHNVHPSTTAYNSAYAMRFTVATGYTGYVSYVKIPLYNNGGAVDHTYKAYFYTVSANLPNTLLAESTNQLTANQISNVSNPMTWYTFTFNSTYQLNAGTTYALVIACTSGTDFSKYVQWGYLASSGGLSDSYYSSAWHTSTNNYCYEIYGVATTPTPAPSIPDNYLSATFGISPSTGGNILWETQSTLNEDGDSLGVGGEVGTYQLYNGSKVSAFAQVNAEYVFDHWIASTGNYTFTPQVNPIKFTGTNNFNLTAVLALANETDCVRIDMPVTSHGHIDITYTIEGFTNTFGNYRFLYVKPGTNITITPDPDTGYIHAQTLITPENQSLYFSDLTQMFISDSLAWTVNYNCTIEGTFTVPAGSTPSTFEVAVLPYLNLLMPVIILAVAALLGYKFAGAWGFFAGVNIGAIITYMVLPTVFPLWGIIALLIIDGLLLFGKVGIRS